MRKRLKKKIFKKHYALLKAKLEASPGKKQTNAVLKEMASVFGIDVKSLSRWEGKTPEEIFGKDLFEE